VTAPGRRQTDSRGRAAETLAAMMQWAKGYRVFDRRARTPFGGIDILALKRGVLAVEVVKARPTREAGLHAITAAARRRRTMAELAAS
jgi:Holliday junction resolvase-like predicted endonuclease